MVVGVVVVDGMEVKVEECYKEYQVVVEQGKEIDLDEVEFLEEVVCCVVGQEEQQREIGIVHE